MEVEGLTTDGGVIVVVTGDKIVGLLKSSKEGLDIIEISNKLNADIKDVNHNLIELQNSHRIVSGLKKYSGSPAFFDRVYFLSSR